VLKLQDGKRSDYSHFEYSNAVQLNSFSDSRPVVHAAPYRREARSLLEKPGIDSLETVNHVAFVR
jgi:hypothetical protein